MANLEKSFDILDDFINQEPGINAPIERQEAACALGLIKGFLLGLSTFHRDNEMCEEFLKAAKYLKEPSPNE